MSLYRNCWGAGEDAGPFARWPTVFTVLKLYVLYVFNIVFSIYLYYYISLPVCFSFYKTHVRRSLCIGWRGRTGCSGAGA